MGLFLGLLPEAEWSAKLTINSHNSRDMSLTKPEVWDQIGSVATCQIFAAGAGVSANIAVASVLTGQIWGVVGGGAGLIAANALANAAGCYEVNPDDGPTSGGSQGIAGGQCLETAGCNLGLRMRSPDGPQYLTVQKLISSVDSGTYPNGTPKATTTYVNCDGQTVTDDEAQEDLWPIYTELLNGASCGGDTSPQPQPGDDLPRPVPVPDPEDSRCVYETQLIDSYINASGSLSILFETCRTGVDCPNPGCERFWYHGPGHVGPAPPEPIPGPDGGPPPVVNPEGDYPPILDEIKECACNKEDFVWPELPSKQYELTGICETPTGDGKQPKWEKNTASGPFYDALASKIDALADMLQVHLGYKTPICPPERPQLKGDWRTITFISDETSPFGKSRLLKRFRYRSESSIELGGLITYWADFTWQAGPVCVQHSGSSVGTPQVWAASADEGKRVIRHAFGEAGIDPDQVGKWTVGGSDNPRYGMPGTMRVNTKGGYYWITARLGSDNRPLVGKT